jgi:hypothetical protein
MKAPLLAAVNLTTGNSIVTNATESTVCVLSPHGRALSSVLTAFVGSIISGISGGHFTAFLTAWICWLASLRIIAVGIWAVIQAVQLKPLNGGSQFHDFYGRIPLLGKLMGGFSGVRDIDDEDAEANSPSFLGWLGWAWSACYSPVIQTLWLVENWDKASGSLKLVRAIGVSVTALPLTMDTRARYGAALGAIFGGWSETVFTFLTAGSCLMLGVLASIELVLGAMETSLKPFAIVVYVLFMLVWNYVSLVFATPYDGARSMNSLGAFLGGLAMGAFGGLFVAAPAFTLLHSAQDTPGSSLDIYLRCESVALWQKLIAVVP